MEQHFVPNYPSGSGIKSGKPGSFFAVILLLITLLPGLTQPPVPLNAQPLLLNLANVNPDETVSVIVQKSFKDDSLEQEVKGLGGTVTADLSFINSFGADLPARQVPFLATKPGVKWISYDAPVVKSAITVPVPSCTGCIDPNLSTNFTDAINANKVWNNAAGTAPWLQGQGIGVAVLDSGVDTTLKDFTDGTGTKSRVLTQAKTNKEAPSINDANGHGTLVASVIGSNGRGSAGAYIGVAPQSQLVSVKVSDDNGASTAMDVLMGMQWIYANKAAYKIRVVNISFNSSVSQSYNLDPLDIAVEALWFNGITVVVSAGNNGTANLFAPANDPFVITVGAAQDKGIPGAPNWIIPAFSAYGKDDAGGSKPDLVAPGVGIFSGVANKTVLLAQQHPDKVSEKKGEGNSDNGKPGKTPPSTVAAPALNTYMRVSGTSFSAPQVTGAVALLLQSNPNLTPDQIKYRLKATALQNTPRGSWDTRTPWAGYNATTAGAGFLDIQAAVTQTTITGKANVGVVPSQLLLQSLVNSGQSPVAGSSVNWSSVNWSSVNWSSVNWSSVNWSSVNWSSVNWSSVNWSSVNWSSTVWDQ